MSDQEEVAGKAKGGVARANALSKIERRAIAKQAAAARWSGGRVYTALHRGSFLENFGMDIACYVLDDPMKTAVISQRGMGEAIGFSRRGSRLLIFAQSKTMDGYLGRELRHKIENPLVFQTSTAAAESSVSSRAHGYDAAILIDICTAILEANADGKLSGSRYAKMIEQARIITSASAKNGIRQLVYALAGYNPTRDEVIEAFKLYVQEEARKYEREFPNELYAEWHRLYQIPVLDRGKPWHFKHLTIKHIYYPLAKSNGKLLTLMRALKEDDGNRQAKLFQFLNELGARALRMHLGRILEMCESSPNREVYERKIIERFGGQHELDLPIPDLPNALPLPS
jgi:hypothetical protein